MGKKVEKKVEMKVGKPIGSRADLIGFLKEFGKPVPAEDFVVEVWGRGILTDSNGKIVRVIGEGEGVLLDRDGKVVRVIRKEKENVMYE